MSQSAEHTMSLALDANTIKQLDDLRRANPNVPNRKQIIESLIWNAHKDLLSKSMQAAA